MDTVLVTGGAGFIGSHVVEKLLERGSFKVRVLDNLSLGKREYIPEDERVEFVLGDITDYSVCEESVKDVTGIFHLAAMSKVAPSLEDPDMIDFCTQQNVIGTLNMLKAARTFGKRLKKFVYSASSTYYGLRPIPQHEDLLPDCQTPYALTKYIGECYCEMFSRLYAVPTVRLRYFMVYGPRQPSTGPYAIVSGIFMKQRLSGEPLTIHGDGSQTRDFVHVYDVAEANIRAFESDLSNETINVGTGKQTSIQQLADWISKKQVYLPPRKVDLKATLSDNTKIRRLLGWEPKIEFEQSVREELTKLQNLIQKN